MREIKTATKHLNVRLTAVEAICEDVTIMKSELQSLKNEVEKRERDLVASDLIINGIPNMLNAVTLISLG